MKWKFSLSKILAVPRITHPFLHHSFKNSIFIRFVSVGNVFICGDLYRVGLDLTFTLFNVTLPSWGREVKISAFFAFTETIALRVYGRGRPCYCWHESFRSI